MTFRIGQKVCAIDDFKDRHGWSMPKKGPVYTVRGIQSNHLGTGLLLNEIRNDHYRFAEGFIEPTFLADCFRPVVERKTDISIFTRMLDQKEVHAQ